MRIESLQVLLPQAVRLLSHAFTKDDETKQIIALDTSGNLIFYPAPFTEQKAQPVQLAFEFNNKVIANVISQGFTNEGIDVLVTVTDKNDQTQFSTYFVNSKTKQSILIFESNSTPMLITNPLTQKPLIVFTNKGVVECGEIDENQKYKRLGDFKLKNGLLPTGIHTSSYIDVTGNLDPNLILHTNTGGTNSVTILDLDITADPNNKNNYIFKPKEIQTLNLNGDAIGPIMFAEMTSSIKPDMLFISQESGKYYLNLYENQSFNENIPKELMSSISGLRRHFEGLKHNKNIFTGNPVKFNLSESILQNGARNISLDLLDGETLPGMYMLDIMGRGVQDIYIVTEASVDPKTATIHMIEFDREKKTFSINQNFANTVSNLGVMTHINGITTFDIENDGVSQMIINYVDAAGIDHMGTVKFKSDIETTGVTLFPLKGTGEVTNFIPGTSFIVVYENEKEIVKTGVYHQSSYMSLQKHSTFVGLNGTNLFINYFTLKIPSKDTKLNTYDAPTFLVPNMSNVFTLQDKNWTIHCFFNIRYYRHALIAMIFLLILFVSIYIILSIQDNKKYKNVVAKDSMERVFNAL